MNISYCQKYPPTRRQWTLAGFVFLSFLLIDCSGSSPRFTGRGSRSSAETANTQQRFATKVRQEEMAEDDKKVDIEEVKERFTPAPERPDRENAIERRKVMTEILELIGTPYAYGNTTDEGLDCSAFTGRIYEKAIGYALPRSTEAQYKMGRSVSGGRLKFGDLLFFNTTGESPSHVGIFIGDDLFAHASVSWGVTVSSLQSSYYKNRYIGARRVIE